MNRAVWFGNSKRTSKPWGYEVEWSGIFFGKQIFINSGSRTSLKFNTHKKEALFITSGKVLLEYADEAHLHDPVQHPSKTKVLSSGELVNIQAGCPYRISALEDSEIFEISDNSSHSRRIVIEDDYGRESPNEKNKWIFKPAVEEQ